MDEQLLQQLAQAGMAPEQLRLLQPQMDLGQQWMQPQHAQGQHVGNTYVAASPLEHLSNAIRQIVGGKMVGDARRRQQEIVAGQQQARQGYMGALQTAQSGGQGGTLGEPGGGMARHPDPQAAQGLMMAGAGSGDPAMQQMAHFGMQSQQLERQNRVLENTLRHQEELERQGRERLGQGDMRVDALMRRLDLQGIKYNPNTGEFVNVGKMAGRGPARGPQPGAGALPGATGAGVQPAGQVAPAGLHPLAGKMLDKALKELGADFDPSGGRSGEFGKNQVRVNAAKRLLTLAQDEQGNARDLTPQQMPELSQALAGLIGGSAGAQAQIEHLTPHSISGDYAKIAQWLTNEPHGSGQQAFVKNMVETAKREKDVAQQGIEAVRAQRGAKHQRVLTGNPEESRKVLKGFGWDLGPDGLPTMGGEKPASAAPDTAALRKKYGL